MVAMKDHILGWLSEQGKNAEDMITLKELTEILTRQTSHGVKPLTPEQCKMVWAVSDPAGGGSVPCDLIASMWSHEPIDRELLLRYTFATCDVNQNGVLSLPEFVALAENQDPASISMQKAVFAMVDENSDGKVRPRPRLTRITARCHAPPVFFLSPVVRRWLPGVYHRTQNHRTRAILFLGLRLHRCAERRARAPLAPPLPPPRASRPQIQLEEFVNFNLESGQGLNDGAFATACSRWTKLAMTRGTALDRPALLKKTFAQVDVDGSGSISQKEYMQLADNNDRVSLEMQKNVFRLADSSGDGILEEEEFVQFNLETGKELNDYDFAQQCRAWTFFARGRG